ncbi:MAG: MerR family transcriptional regulator [Deltaproteobacteria bacterium]|nr:MerR family transcriptional regulator [Deltaproteobacteria bacterium]
MTDDSTSVLARSGRYRIQTVAELTGVPASTLRAWEHRYGFPAPERTASAYRLYSDADVARIVRVRALCDGGVAAAEAVAAVLAEADDAVASAASVRPPGIAPPSATALATVRGESFDALERFEQRLRGALMVGSPAEAMAAVIEPAWAQLRNDWIAGARDRGEHRMFGELLAHAVRDVVRMGQPARAEAHGLVGAFDGDDELVPVGQLALAAQAAGLRVVWLGARVAPGVLHDACTRHPGVVIGLGCTESLATVRARELVAAYAEAVAPHRWIAFGPGALTIAGLLARAGAEVATDAAKLRGLF